MKTRECPSENLKDLRPTGLIVKIRYRHHQEESSFLFQAAENQSLPTQPDQVCYLSGERIAGRDSVETESAKDIGILMPPEWNEMAEGFENWVYGGSQAGRCW